MPFGLTEPKLEECCCSVLKETFVTVSQVQQKQSASLALFTTLQTHTDLDKPIMSCDEHLLRERSSREQRRRTENRRSKQRKRRFTCVTLVTVAYNLSVPVVLVTGSSKVPAAVGPIRTGTWTALAAGR